MTTLTAVLRSHQQLISGDLADLPLETSSTEWSVCVESTVTALEYEVWVLSDALGSLG